MTPKEKKPIYKKWWFWLIVVFVVVGIGGASQTGSEDTPSVAGTPASSQEVSGSAAQDTTVPAPTATPKPEKYEVVGDIAFEDDGLACYLSGTLKNNSGKECSYIQISFNLYDAEGNQIGTAMDNLNNLADGGTWKFKAMGVDANGDVASWELADISAF